MSTSDAKKAWMEKNTTVLTVRFTHNTEQYLLDYLSDKPIATTIKNALKEYMQNHPDEKEETNGL